VKFLVFAGDKYYPQGGWGDFESSHENYEDARSAALACAGHGCHGDIGVSDWSHVVDLSTMKIVFQVAGQTKAFTGGRVRELHCVAWDAQGNMLQSILTL
jgi:hypothetical protein